MSGPVRDHRSELRVFEGIGWPTSGGALGATASNSGPAATTEPTFSVAF